MHFVAGAVIIYVTYQIYGKNSLDRGGRVCTEVGELRLRWQVLGVIIFQAPLFITFKVRMIISIFYVYYQAYNIYH